MMSALERFQKNVIGTQTTVNDYTPVVSSIGDFSKVSEIEAILYSWNNILLTPIRTYNHNPEYGSELYKYVYEPQDEVTIEQIKDEINFRLMLYDDRAKVTNIKVTYMSDNHGFILDIDVEFEGDTSTLQTGITREAFKFESSL